MDTSTLLKIIGDFAFLNRPIIFYSYDFDHYCQNNHMDPAYMSVLHETYVKNEEKLYGILEKIFQAKIDFHSTVESINSYLNAQSLRNGGYCRNVCQHLFEKLDL